MIAVFVIHLAIPIQMAIFQETILRQGREYKFRTQPIDPYDAFRGRYIALSFEEANKNNQNEYKSKIYLPIGVGEDGFAVIKDVLIEKPESGDFVIAKTNKYFPYRIILPFDRYYINENLANLGQKVLDTSSEEKDAYALVKVHKGNCALKELYIKDKPILEYLREIEDRIK